MNSIEQRFVAGEKSSKGLWFLVIAVLIVVSCFTGPATAAELKDVRVGEHPSYTRVVFEFTDVVRFRSPVEAGKGQIVVAFLGSTAISGLPIQKLQERTRKITAITIGRDGKQLKAVLTLHSPDFRLKTFSLLKPYRVVLDVYWKGVPVAAPVVRSPLSLEPAASPLIQPATQLSLPPAFSRYSKLQLYILIVLVVLNVITVIMLVVLSFSFLRNRDAVPSRGQKKIKDSLKYTDDSVVSIDSKIREEFRKYQDL